MSPEIYNSYEYRLNEILLRWSPEMMETLGKEYRTLCEELRELGTGGDQETVRAVTKLLRRFMTINFTIFANDSAIMRKH